MWLMQLGGMGGWVWSADIILEYAHFHFLKVIRINGIDTTLAVICALNA